MTTHRSVFGLVAPRCSGEMRSLWNSLFFERGIDAVFDYYRTTDDRDLELRLSEMFHLDRRGYIVHPSLATSIVPLLDQCDTSTMESGRVNVVINRGGLLIGYFTQEGEGREERILDCWMEALRLQR